MACTKRANQLKKGKKVEPIADLQINLDTLT